MYVNLNFFQAGLGASFLILVCGDPIPPVGAPLKGDRSVNKYQKQFREVRESPKINSKRGEALIGELFMWGHLVVNNG